MIDRTQLPFPAKAEEIRPGMTVLGRRETPSAVITVQFYIVDVRDDVAFDHDRGRYRLEEYQWTVLEYKQDAELELEHRIASWLGMGIAAATEILAIIRATHDVTPKVEKDA